MRKLLWMIPFFIGLIGCGANDGCDGTFTSCCRGGTKRHEGSSLHLNFYPECPFEEECDTFFSFWGAFYDSLRGECGTNFRYKLKMGDSVYSVKNGVGYLFSSRNQDDIVETDYDGITYYNKAYNKRFKEFVGFSLFKNDHIQFSLVDADKVSKDYDIDVSEIIHSYEYVGDSVRVRVPDNCSLTICPKDARCIRVFGGNLLDGQYIFSANEEYKESTGMEFDCWLYNQSSFGTDKVELSFSVYWK